MGYPGFYRFDYDDKAQPSNLYTEIIDPLKMFDKKAFNYVARVTRPFLNSQELKEPKINKLILPYLKRMYPQLIDDNDCLKSKYMFTAKYAKAEYTSIAKYAHEYKLPMVESWDMATNMVAEAFSVMDHSPILDYHSAVRMLDRQTSPGYPWTLKHMNKQPLLDSDWFDSWYYNWERQVWLGEMHKFYWRCFIKDEVKKKEDVLADNPRSILASPIQASILGNRLFGPMNEKMTRAGAAFQLPCWVGVSKFNRRWHRLLMHIMHFPNRAHGDCTRFDGSVSPISFEFIARFREHCLSHSNIYVKRGVKYFYENVLNSLIVGWNGDLFSKQMGQPSGQANTLHDNSIIHVLYWFYHWCLVVVPKLNVLPTWQSFKEHVHLVVMGDDVIYSYSDYVKELMDPKLVAQTFDSLAVKLKYELVNDISQLEFCSMHFVNDEGIYVPVMKREKMLASMFIKDDINPRMYLRRLLAIRVEVWWDREMRDIINNCIDYIIDRFRAEMSSRPTGVSGDDLTLDMIMELKWSNYIIDKHYKSNYE